MPTLQKQIVEKFLTNVTSAKSLDQGMIEELRNLFDTNKKPKAEDFVKILSQPIGGDLK